VRASALVLGRRSHGHAEADPQSNLQHPELGNATAD